MFSTSWFPGCSSRLDIAGQSEASLPAAATGGPGSGTGRRAAAVVSAGSAGSRPERLSARAASPLRRPAPGGRRARTRRVPVAAGLLLSLAAGLPLSLAAGLLSSLAAGLLLSLAAVGASAGVGVAVALAPPPRCFRLMGCCD